MEIYKRTEQALQAIVKLQDQIDNQLGLLLDTYPALNQQLVKCLRTEDVIELRIIANAARADVSKILQQCEHRLKDKLNTIEVLLSTT